MQPEGRYSGWDRCRGSGRARPRCAARGRCRASRSSAAVSCPPAGWSPPSCSFRRRARRRRPRPGTGCHRVVRAAAATGSGRPRAGRTDRGGTVRPRTSALRSRLVAAITRTSVVIVRGLPTRSNSPSSRTRSSFDWSSSGSSAISSRRRVAPSAISNRPDSRETAPV